jgi:hypothetical protein
LHEAQIDTALARACVIPSEQHVVVADHDRIAFAKAPVVPPNRGRITDTRVGLS